LPQPAVTTTEIDARDSDAASGVSPVAIFPGAAAAAARSMILVVLGAGLGRANVSPWLARPACRWPMPRSACPTPSRKRAPPSRTPKRRPVAYEARKAAAVTSLWMFVALLAGAFFASVAALSGGRRRDSRA
jgi:hypothetical protein